MIEAVVFRVRGGSHDDYEYIGEKHGALVVHNTCARGWDGFYISHIATGYAVSHEAMPLDQARERAEQILALGLDWEFAEATEIPAATSKAMRGLIASWGEEQSA